MANFIRSAKSGSDWTRSKLLAYNIEVVSQSPEQFFGVSAAGVPLAGLDPLIITGSVHMENLSDSTLSYLELLELATTTNQEPFVDEFSRRTLDLLGYCGRGINLLSCYSIPLTICGDSKYVTIDLCLAKVEASILLILKEDKISSNDSDPETQVIVEAIAAYQYNNARRMRRGLSSLDSMVFPCITMIRTCPTFYLVPVTNTLSDAIISGQCPSVPTEVRKCAITEGRHGRFGLWESMEQPEYRRVALERLLAFKALAKSHWERFLV